jgi:hypothetical protein
MIRPDTKRIGTSFRNHELHHRMGSCCAACAATGGSCGGYLGAVNCDQDGNCYDDSTGTYTPAPVLNAAASVSANTSSITTWLSQNSTTLAAVAAVAGIVAFVAGRK